MNRLTKINIIWSRFLIPPFKSNKQFVKVYLPGDDWYDLHSGKNIQGGEKIIEVRNERFPVFVKGSSIIPMQSLIQSTAEKPGDLLEVHLYNGKDSNSFEYYEDDGKTYGYLKGDYYKRTIAFKPREKANGIFKGRRQL